jgi:uncharacterized membrane protein YqjE
MSNETQSPRAERGPLRRMLSSLYDLMQTRLELLSIELAEERDRLVAVLVLGIVAVMLGMLAMISLTALVTVLFWDTYRWQVLAIMTGVYVVGAIVCAVRARVGLREAPTIFEASLHEFEKDREMFREP